MDAKAARFLSGLCIVIVSGDTQRLAPSSTPMASAGYLEMKAVLNHLYARSHGYDFWYLVLPVCHCRQQPPEDVLGRWDDG